MVETNPSQEQAKKKARSAFAATAGSAVGTGNSASSSSLNISDVSPDDSSGFINLILGLIRILMGEDDPEQKEQIEENFEQENRGDAQVQVGHLSPAAPPASSTTPQNSEKPRTTATAATPAVATALTSADKFPKDMKFTRVEQKGTSVYYYTDNGDIAVKSQAQGKNGREGTVSWLANNPGNIVYGQYAKDNGAIGKYAVKGTDGITRNYAIFPSVESGFQAQMKLLTGPAYRDLTLSQAINKYAPAADNNDPQKYVRFVSGRTGISAETKLKDLNQSQLASLAQSISVMEGFNKTGALQIARAGTPSVKTPPEIASTSPTASGTFQTAAMGTGANAPVILPLSQRVSSGHGMRHHPVTGVDHQHHDGIDIAAPIGTDVPALARGRVVYAGWATGYGNTVALDHGNGVITLYGHLSKINVKVGDEIAEGQKFAKTGNTGLSSGPHLHYEIMAERNGRAYTVDAQEYNLKSLIASKTLQKEAVEDALSHAGKNRDQVASLMYDVALRQNMGTTGGVVVASVTTPGQQQPRV